MTDGAPALTIRIRPNDDKAFLFEGVGGRTIAIGSKQSFQQSIFEQASLRTMLEELKKIGGGALELSLPQADEFLQKLHEAGKLILYGLLGEDVWAYAADLRELVADSLAAGTTEGRIPWVHITTPDNDPIAHAIPFELIPFRASEPPRSVAEDETRLAEVLDGFLGFKAVVRRDRGDMFDGGMIAHTSDGVPVKLFQNLSLKNAKAEMDYFRTAASFDIDGPWPVDALTLKDFKETLLRQIFDPRARIDGTPRASPDQIHHFACHCDTFGDAAGHRLILEGADGQPLPLALKDLRLKQLEIAENRAASTCDMPLVFLNACGSAAVDPRQLGSFVHFFLLNRNRGLIGAQIMIPNEFAAAFAELFYSELVANGKNVGEAVLLARRRLAERKRNMLGLLYMHYGPPELRLAA